MRPPTAVVVEAREVARVFAPRRGGAPVDAVRRASITVAPGEFVALSGPSGSGKTTFLHLLAAIDTPTAGTVVLAGHEVATLSRGARADLRLRSVGLVLAAHNLAAALTAAENVDLPLALRGLARADRAARVGAALERVGATRFADRIPDDLSSGEQQRVAMARAIAGDPALLVADEPTAHLDRSAAESLVALLAELVRERGMSAVVATHDDVVLRGATRVVRIRDGTTELPA